MLELMAVSVCLSKCAAVVPPCCVFDTVFVIRCINRHSINHCTPTDYDTAGHNQTGCF